MSNSPDIEARLVAWTEAELVTAEQAASIRAWEAEQAPGAFASPVAPTTSSVGATVATTGSESVRDRMAGSLGVLGGLLVGLGVLLTVAANWDGIGDTAKVLTIVLSLAVAHAAGIWADARGAARWIGTAAFTISTLVFAGGVFLLGQLFHVRAHDPFGFLVVAIVATAVALLASRQVVGWIAAAAWLAWGTHEFIDLLFDEDEALQVVGACLLLGITALSLGWVFDGIAERRQATLQGDDRPLAADLDVLGSPMRSTALVGLLGLLLPLSFAWHASGEDLGDGGFGIATMVGAIVALAAAWLLSRSGSPAARTRVAMVLAGVVVLVVLAGLVPDGVVIGLLANVVLVGGGIGLALLGLSEDRRGTYAWGVVWIIVTIVARYVDAMVAFAFGGLGFIGAGLLLIGCGWLVGRSRRIWRTREELL